MPKGQAEQVQTVDSQLEIRLTDGRKLKLRGIEPPRGTASNPQLAETARQFLAERVAGKSVMAEIFANTPDRWGRYSAEMTEGTSGSLSSELVGAGWARVEASETDIACLATRFRLETAARQAKRGLWADPAYNVLAAADRSAFAHRSGQIVLVEGTVSSVGKWRTLTFLNLGRDRRADPAIVLSRRVTQGLEKANRTTASLEGANVRVRGLLQVRNAPRIEIFSPNAIEILSAAPARNRPQGNKN